MLYRKYHNNSRTAGLAPGWAAFTHGTAPEHSLVICKHIAQRSSIATHCAKVHGPSLGRLTASFSMPKFYPTRRYSANQSEVLGILATAPSAERRPPTHVSRVNEACLGVNIVMDDC